MVADGVRWRYNETCSMLFDNVPLISPSNPNASPPLLSSTLCIIAVKFENEFVISGNFRAGLVLPGKLAHAFKLLPEWEIPYIDIKASNRNKKVISLSPWKAEVQPPAESVHVGLIWKALIWRYYIPLTAGQSGLDNILNYSSILMKMSKPTAKHNHPEREIK